MKEFSLFQWYHLAIVVISWIIGMQIAEPVLGVVSGNGRIPSFGFLFLALGGGIGGLFSGYTIRWAQNNLTHKQILIIAFGWAVGLNIGVLLPPAVIPWLHYGYEFNQLVRFIIAGLVTGGIGGYIMIWQIKSVANISQWQIKPASDTNVNFTEPNLLNLNVASKVPPPKVVA
jgi:hypothetical protein